MSADHTSCQCPYCGCGANDQAPLTDDETKWRRRWNLPEGTTASKPPTADDISRLADRYAAKADEAGAEWVFDPLALWQFVDALLLEASNGR